MAEECIDICSVGASSSTPAVWWDVHPDSVSSWSNTNPSCWNHKNPNSNSSCDEEVSISTSALSVVSNGDLITDHVSDHQLWSHVLLSIGNNGEIQTNQELGGIYMNRLSSKLTDSSTSMMEPACNYLKKLESSWEEDDHFSNSSPSFNSFDHQKQPIGFGESMIENERLLKLSDLVSSWSIALPDPETTRHFNNNNNSNHPSMNSCVKSVAVHDINQSLSNSGSIGTIASDSESFSCYEFDHDMKLDQKGHHHEIEIPGDFFRRSFNGSGMMGYQDATNGSSTLGDDCKDYLGNIIPRTPSRNLADFISFTNRFRKPLMNIQAQKPSSKFSNLSERKRQNLQNSSPTTRAGGRELGASSTDRRKKKSEDPLDSATKKPKLETSTPSSAKQPKVKTGEKITTLQQIVSPFGKTDTASVLSEAIGYIKFLQEQVQLLSNPYMKTSFHKDPWGLGMERREKGEVMKFDLKSRGLCLVPISCAPQVCHENNGSDHYWAPYRGCFHR